MSAIQPKVDEPVSDELTLVQAAKSGDVSAFEELVRRYDRNVFRIAQHITQNREDAEDVVQDAFLKAYSNLAQFQGQSKFYTWLVRIAVNEALMKLRRRRPERTVSLDEEVKTEEDSLPREVAEAMAKEIERKMRDAAANLEFEKAAALRDELVNLRKQIGGNESLLFQGKAPKIFQHALKELIGT